MAEAIPSLAPMVQVSPPPAVIASNAEPWLWLVAGLGVLILLLLIWQRWRLWLWWQRVRVNERTAQTIARQVYGRLWRRLPPRLSHALQRIAFAPHVSHETIHQLKQLLRQVRP
ncbi:MAG TPA: hypothetical protein EYH46_07480 [Sulfurivirga caldicuralii]|nr:hypothetical protein [Sulfurivirga caldicuralii]